MDPQVLSIILSAFSLGFDIKTVISDFIKSNKKLNDLLNKAIEKAKRKASIDSQHLPGKPFGEKELNNELLDLVIKHAKGESNEIPNWLGNDFDTFYESITQDVEFLKFLHQEIENYQHSLQIQKLDESNQKIEKTKELLKKIKSQIEIISQRIELPKWLISYDVELSTNSKTVFLQDAHENLIRENKIYRKKDTIDAITNWLDTKGACLIIAPEGRGKTFLSRIIAFDYHENNTMVYFVDCRNESKPFYDDMKSLLFNWNNDKDKENLLILENIHACTDLERLKQYIENQIRHEEIATNIKFLLNARPTIVDYDCFTNWEETIYLHPNENDVQEIVNLYKTVINRNPFESEKKMMAFIKIISPNENDSNGTNLRLLSIYLRTWQNNSNIRYVSDVTEGDIYGDFITTYKLDVSLDRDTVLLFISSLFQFDVPVHLKAIKQFLKNENINYNLLQDLVKEGLLIKSRNLYYLPHSVEAYFLFKAICYKQKENYIDKTEEFVRFFIDDFILKQNKPRDFEGEFRLLISGLLARKEEYDGLVKELTEWNRAKVIIEKINPGFVIQMFHTKNGHDEKTLCSIFDNNMDTLRPCVIPELHPSQLNRLCNGLENHLKYDAEEIFYSIFKSPEELRKYLSHWSAIYNDTSKHFFFNFFFTRYRRIIKNIAPEYAIVCEEFRNHYNCNHKKNNKQNYDFLSIEKKGRKNLISNTSVRKDYYECDKTQFQDLISKLCTNGFYINELNWRQLDCFLRKMGDCIDETHKDSFQQVANALVEMIIDKDNVFLEKPNALEKASPAHLSHFLFNLSRIDDTLYNDTILNDIIIEIVDHKLEELDTITIDELIDYLYLFSYFYSQPWCKVKMNSFIDKANEEQLDRIKEWHDKVRERMEKRGEEMEIESMLAYIHKKHY